MKKNLISFIPFIIGAVLGAAVFIGLFGTRILSPAFTDWIFAAPDDTTQHYIGWMYYRNTAWTFPIGMTDGLTSSGAVSCIYADTIPLFAVFFKLLSPVLPETFQYFGLWGVICFALNGGFGAVLLSRINKNLIFVSLGSVFYSLFFPSVMRITHHNSLGAIWLIMIAMIITLDRKRDYRFRFTPVILWSLNCFLASAIHPYFLPMIFTVMTGYLILLVFRDKKYVQAVCTFGFSVISAIANLWILGAFEGEGNYIDGGLGTYSANLNTFFNSFGYSKYIRPLGAFPEQTEGYGYLGLGMLVCCFLALIIAVSRIHKKDGSYLKFINSYIKAHSIEIIALFAVFSIGFLWAVSPRITLNNNIVKEIYLPAIVTEKLSIFRASGRFIWTPCLIVMTIALWLVSKLDRNSAVAAVLICAWLQCNDVRNLRNGFRTQYRNPAPIEYGISDAEWEKVSDGVDEIIFLPLPADYLAKIKLYYDFARPAARDKIRLSSFIVCRSLPDDMRNYADKQYEMLKSGKGRNDALYVFFNEEDVPQNVNGVEISKIGDYSVARVKK